MGDLIDLCLLLCDHADNVSDRAVYLLLFSTTLQCYYELERSVRDAMSSLKAESLKVTHYGEDMEAKSPT